MQDKTVVNDGAKWEFNAEVEAVFDNMLERSIPNYQTMRDLVYRIGKNYIKHNMSVIDMGCSNGLSVARFVQDYDNDFYLYDVSQPMLDSARTRYADKKRVHVEHHDLRTGVKPELKPCLILSILTVQFVPIEYRQTIIKSVHDALDSGGAFVFVEKLLGSNAEINDLLTKEYYDIKAENAYTQEQIASKRRSLEGVLVPVTAKWNEDLLREAGFKKVECFWRELNFAGWLAVKD